MFAARENPAAAAGFLAAASPGQFMAPRDLARFLDACRASDRDKRHDPAKGVLPDPGSLYLTPALLANLPAAKDPVLQEWRRFIAPAGEGTAGEAMLASDTGLAVLRQGRRGVVIAPPFPVREYRQLPGWDDGPLWQLLTAEYTVGVVLLRLGRYLVAVFRGQEPLTTRTDTRYVKGKHHAGGTSQLRFQRIREGQARKLFDEACGVVKNRFMPYEEALDYILLGGDKLTLNGFMKVCPYLQQQRGKILGRRLNIRDPRADTLPRVAGMLRESRVWLL